MQVSGRGGVQRALRWFLTARSSSLAGSGVSTAALPIVAVVTLSASPAELGLLVAALPAGMLVARPAAAVFSERSRRPILALMCFDLVAAILIGLVPTLAAFSALSAPVLILLAFGVGATTGASGAYSAPLMVSLVTEDKLEDVNGKIATVSTAADIGGAGIAALLVKLFSAPACMIVDAVSYMVSATAYSQLRRTHAHPTMSDDAQDPTHSLLSAMAYPLRMRTTRLLMVGVWLAALLNGAAMAVITPFMVRILGISPSVAVLATVGGAAGGVTGGLLIDRVLGRFGPLRAFERAIILAAAGFVALPLAPHGIPGFLLCLVYETVGGFSATVMIVVAFSALQRELPAAVRARGLAGASLVPELGTIIGAIAGGSVASAAGTRVLLAALAVLAMASLMARWAYQAPHRRSRVERPAAELEAIARTCGTCDTTSRSPKEVATRIRPAGEAAPCVGRPTLKAPHDAGESEPQAPTCV